MALLSREQILEADDMKIVRAPVDEWEPGGEVLLRTMSGLERAQFDADVIVTKDGVVDLDKVKYFSELLARTLVSEDGQRLFSTAAEVQQLMTKNGAVLTRLGRIALRINGLSG